MLVHKFVPAKKEAYKTVITFNGTGADENDLISFLLPIIDQNTNILGLRGKYQMNRWAASGVGEPFNKEELKKDGDELINGIKGFSESYEFDLSKIVFLGFSNGANFIISFLYTFPNFCKHAVCMHCMKPFELENSVDFSSSKILLTHGKNDQFASDTEVEEVANYFESNGAIVKKYFYDGDHFYVGNEEIEVVKDFLNKF